jgi:hypothetical protein
MCYRVFLLDLESIHVSKFIQQTSQKDMINDGGWIFAIYCAKHFTCAILSRVTTS